MTVMPGATLASDVNALATLRTRANADPKAAVREVAKQFEALFMQELMKSMRASTLSSGMLDNEGSKLGTDMLDHQFATQMTGLQGGLSDAIVKQLERQMGMAPGPIPTAKAASLVSERPLRIPDKGAADFVQRHTDAARVAEARTGIASAFMIGQAAHETGWGRKEIRHTDGSPSFNLFGIKANADWKGPVAETLTTEVINGQPVKTVARFRAYASYAESFADYARLMQTSPRYQQVLAQGRDASAFANGLQRAGYATDPAYADKLTRIINTTLRIQRAAS